MKPTFKHIAALTTGAIALCSFGISSAADLPLATTVPAVEQIVKSPTVTTHDLKATSLASQYSNDREFVADYYDQRLRFSSEESRDSFLADPNRFLPKFNGFVSGGPLAKNNLRIGKIDQYSLIEDEIKFDSNASSKSYYGNETDNIFLRAQLDF